MKEVTGKDLNSRQKCVPLGVWCARVAGLHNNQYIDLLIKTTAPSGKENPPQAMIYD